MNNETELLEKSIEILDVISKLSLVGGYVAEQHSQDICRAVYLLTEYHEKILHGNIN